MEIDIHNATKICFDNIIVVHIKNRFIKHSVIFFLSFNLFRGFLATDQLVVHEQGFSGWYTVIYVL